MAGWRRSRGVARSRGGVSLAAAAALLLLALLGSCGRQMLGERGSGQPAGPGSVAVERFWVEPEDGIAPVLREMASADRSLDVVVYLLTNPAIVEELVAAHRRGVEVRVMVEEEPFGGGKGNGDALEALEAAGVPWQFGNPTFRYTHEKAIIADRERALVMTANLTKSAFTRNREYIALLTSPPEVTEIQALFDADWDRRGYKPRAASLVVSDANSREKLLELLGNARRSLEIEAEVMSDREIRRALVDAQARGVEVRVVMSAPEPEETTHAGLTELSGEGVGVRLVENPYIHAKSVVADGERAYVGSINFTANSMDQNRELGVLTADPSVLRRLGETFEADWAKGDTFEGGR